MQGAMILAGLFRQLTDERGRYDASKLARALDWSQEDVARYLGKTSSAISKNPASVSGQEALARLAALVDRAEELTGGMAATVTWLRTPILALDNASPKEFILAQEIGVVENLLGEYESGLAL